MEDSILESIKNLLGIEEECTTFDKELVVHINSELMVLNQLGVGITGFSISDKSSTWNDFLGEINDLDAVRSYVYLRVRLVFDPPTSSALLTSMQNRANEYEWRLNVAVDPRIEE